jgi:uncharacterized protein with GYD domain
VERALACASSRLQLAVSSHSTGGYDHADIHHRHELDRTGNFATLKTRPSAPPKRAKSPKSSVLKIKQTYLTNGEFDLISIIEMPSGDNIAKFCMQVGALGNVRTRTMRAWPESEYHKLISELS